MTSPVQKEVKKLGNFRKWEDSLKNPETRAIIDARIKRLEHGLYGDVEPVGEGVSELRIHFGPGYRVYFTEVEGTVLLLLAGGNKSTQNADIRLAQQLLHDIKAKAAARKRK